MCAAQTPWDNNEDIRTLSDQGDACMEKRDIEGAVGYYTEAIDMIEESRHVNPQIEALMWASRAEAHSKLGNHREAVSDARRAVNANPEGYEECMILSKAHEALKEYSESLEMRHVAFKNLIGSYDPTCGTSVGVDPILEHCLFSYCVLICTVKDVNLDLAEKYFAKMRDCCQPRVITDTIVKRDRFDLFLIFLQMRIDRSMKVRFREVFASTVYDHYTPGQEDASIAGLQSGILSLEDIATPQMPIPLFFAVFRGLRTDSTKLLSHMLQHYYTTKAQVEVFDVKGQTIVHYVYCAMIDGALLPGGRKVLECLKAFDHVDLMMKNCYRQSVTQLPTKSHRILLMFKTRNRGKDAKTETSQECTGDDQKEQQAQSNENIAKHKNKSRSRKKKKRAGRNNVEQEVVQEVPKSSEKDKVKEQTEECPGKNKLETKQEETNVLAAHIGDESSAFPEQERGSLQSVKPQGRKDSSMVLPEAEVKPTDCQEKKSGSAPEDDDDVKCESCDAIINFTITDSGVKLGVPSSKLPAILAKMGVIELH